MVYVTNGELESVEEGESVTFEAHVVTSTPDYTFTWSIKEEGVSDWATVGDYSSTWTWTPGSGAAGTYNVRCRVTDTKGGSGEVVWKGFEVSS